MRMEVLKAEVNLPSSFLAAIKIRADELGLFIRRSLAVELYREGKVSLGKVAEVAGVRNKWEMLMLLNEKGVPIDYTAEDAEKDLKTVITQLESG
jgi:predicted HTH domain antitoxin